MEALEDKLIEKPLANKQVRDYAHNYLDDSETDSSSYSLNQSGEFVKHLCHETIEIPQAKLSSEEADDVFTGDYKVGLWQRCFEIIVSLTALIITAPIMLVITIIIKQDSHGPALFRHKRVGINRNNFDFMKFRTLYADAKERFPNLYAYQYDNQDLENLKFKITNDPRVTPQGRWLRKSTLDELPNFWCVLKGDMALVGPRPEIPEMVPYYKGKMLKKFSVKPGITGLAQVSGRGNLGFYETVDLDVEYVENRSFFLDLKIIFLTIKKVLLRDGAF